MAVTLESDGHSLPVHKALAAGLRVLEPTAASVLFRDFLSLHPGRSLAASTKHLDATMNWLCRAQDACGGYGVASGYSLIDGWESPYPEVTGYIIPTFYDYAALTGREEFCVRARRMADWEIDVQLPSGAVQAGLYNPRNTENRWPAVFNTGQVILGWCRAFTETQDQRYVDAAIRAAAWLIRLQAQDGSWNLESPITQTVVHAYDVRTAWSLIELSCLINESRYSEAARRNVEWTLKQQEENGWFLNNSFFKSNVTFTHNIGYVMEGILGFWHNLKEHRYLEAVQRTADRLLRIFELRQFMAGDFDPSWKGNARYSCLTGDAQIAGTWLRLFEETGDVRYLNGALKLSDYVKGTQGVHVLNPGIRGGVKGSHPIAGSYTPFTYVSWGAKFLADSLMLEERLMAALERELLAGQRHERSNNGALKTRS